MNNNLYHWHDEHMVAYEMQEINRAVEQDRLLKDAGLSSGGWLGRAADALFNLLRRPNKGIQDHRSIEQRS
jgi:hypothetical protein